MISVLKQKSHGLIDFLQLKNNNCNWVKICSVPKMYYQNNLPIKCFFNKLSYKVRVFRFSCDLSSTETQL